MLIEGVDELSLYLLFIIIIFYRVFISMDFRHGNGRSGFDVGTELSLRDDHCLFSFLL